MKWDNDIMCGICVMGLCLLLGVHSFCSSLEGESGTMKKMSEVVKRGFSYMWILVSEAGWLGRGHLQSV